MRVRFWTMQTGMHPQTGVVIGIITTKGIECAEIAPDNGGPLVYLCQRSVWGYEPIEENAVSHFDDVLTI